MATDKNNEIYRGYDEYGPVQVFDDGNRRHMAFGEGDQQSCMLKSAPTQLHYDYTRAMALTLLLAPKAKTALLLGLGAGSLAGFIYASQPQLQITAVELRQLVIDTALKYFQLPRSPRLQLLAEDARHFLQRTEPANYDIIFSDIYTGEGVADLQLQESYLDMCDQCLHSSGWLVLNCWREHQADQDLLDILQQRFSSLYSCTTQSGNWVLFAAKGTTKINLRNLQNQAKAWGEQVGFNFTSLLKKITPIT